jgi:hypothetical protein
MKKMGVNARLLALPGKVKLASAKIAKRSAIFGGVNFQQRFAQYCIAYDDHTRQAKG